MNDNCQTYRDKLVAYVNNELPPRTVRRMTQHLQSCDTCYAAYIRERDTAAHLTRELTLFGKAGAPQLSHIWAEIETKIEKPVPRPARPNWHRGLVGVALAALVVLPWTLSLGDTVTGASLLPANAAPAAAEETPVGTETHDENGRKISMKQPTEDAQPPTPTSTPAVAPEPDNNS